MERALGSGSGSGPGPAPAPNVNGAKGLAKTVERETLSTKVVRLLRSSHPSVGEPREDWD